MAQSCPGDAIDAIQDPMRRSGAARSVTSIDATLATETTKDLKLFSLTVWYALLVFCHSHVGIGILWDLDIPKVRGSCQPGVLASRLTTPPNQDRCTHDKSAKAQGFPVLFLSASQTLLPRASTSYIHVHTPHMLQIVPLRPGWPVSLFGYFICTLITTSAATSQHLIYLMNPDNDIDLPTTTEYGVSRRDTTLYLKLPIPLSFSWALYIFFFDHLLILAPAVFPHFHNLLAAYLFFFDLLFLMAGIAF